MCGNLPGLQWLSDDGGGTPFRRSSLSIATHLQIRIKKLLRLQTKLKKLKKGSTNLLTD